MREIKFRGRVNNTINPQWVYGIVIPPQYSSWEDWTLFDGERRWIIDPETVGRFTGYKDINGTDVYEGDILGNTGFPREWRVVCFGEYADPSEKEKYHIGFHVKFRGPRLNDLYRKELGYWMKEAWKCRVVGNIHDNPKLFMECK